MENLLFKHTGRGWFNRIIGIFWILFGIAELLFLQDKPLTLLHCITSIAFVLIGVIFLTPLVGNNETRFVVGDDNLKIKWRTKIGEIIIKDNEIEKIILRIVLLFDQWKLEDKTKVYGFMIEYARQKNIPLEK